jgi:large subunit ribosomal protein L18
MRKSLKKIKSESKAKEQRRKLSKRICATKTNKNLFVQVIDDAANKTILSVQTFGKNAAATSANTEGAKVVGTKLAEALVGKNIKNAVFDRNGKKYTGVVAALADSIREGGIQI